MARWERIRPKFYVIIHFSCLLLLHSRSVSGWLDSGATWYDLRQGAGTGGGACGYQDDVEKPPFSSMIAAGGPSIFKDGKGCGVCYQVKCTGNAPCFGRPVTVVVTDLCPGGEACLAEAAHFNLSGKAFDAMAKPGQADNLRDAGDIRVQYHRVPCKWRGLNYLAVLINHESGDDDLSTVELQQRGRSWAPMQQLLGAVWKYSSEPTLQAPISIRLTTSAGKELVASDVIPSGWQADKTYRSIVN
ncbi:putative expansin-B14 [Triticum dicoccoides]|uniref:putative expansin-B14 n=1 Tax=Triticum dicoccoides TaxID=85692 RepID=UPI0018905F12|nr:putative expansin-B14 [Triticum dicoccoides]